MKFMRKYQHEISEGGTAVTRAEYQAQKAMKARMRQTEQKHTQAAKGPWICPS